MRLYPASSRCIRSKEFCLSCTSWTCRTRISRRLVVLSFWSFSNPAISTLSEDSTWDTHGYRPTESTFYLASSSSISKVVACFEGRIVSFSMVGLHFHLFIEEKKRLRRYGVICNYAGEFDWGKSWGVYLLTSQNYRSQHLDNGRNLHSARWAPLTRLRSLPRSLSAPREFLPRRWDRTVLFLSGSVFALITPSGKMRSDFAQQVWHFCRYNAKRRHWKRTKLGI